MKPPKPDPRPFAEHSIEQHIAAARWHHYQAESHARAARRHEIRAQTLSRKGLGKHPR